MVVDVKTEITIHASLDKIWTIFTDFDNYPDWNPFIQYVKGPVAVGNIIKVGIMGMSFKPTVLRFQEKKEFCWKGHFIVPGIFDGEHYFTLQAQLNGSVLFKHDEKFSGILIPFFKNLLNNKVKSRYEAMNWKLKELAEQS